MIEEPTENTITTKLQTQTLKTKEKCFNCEYPDCLKSFKTKGNLKTHILIHVTIF